MPRSPFHGRQNAVIAQICAGLSAGATLAEICRRPGMPRYWTVMRWQRADPQVKARLHAARGWSYQRASTAERQAAVTRVEAGLMRGWTLKYACSQPWAPSIQTLWNWAAEDPGVMIRLRQAREAGRGMRPRWAVERYHYDYDRVDGFIARVEAGESVAAMQRARTAPEPELIRAWKNMRADFVERYAAAKRKGAAVRRLRPRRPFDAAVADAIVARVNRGETLSALMREPGMPGFAALGRWRRVEPGFDFALKLAKMGGRKTQRRARAGPTPRLTRRLANAVVGGATIKATCRLPGMPTPGTVSLWRRRYPDFDAALTLAEDFRDELLDEARAERVLKLVETGTPEALAEGRRLLGRRGK